MLKRFVATVVSLGMFMTSVPVPETVIGAFAENDVSDNAVEISEESGVAEENTDSLVSDIEADSEQTLAEENIVDSSDDESSSQAEEVSQQDSEISGYDVVAPVTINEEMVGAAEGSSTADVVKLDSATINSDWRSNGYTKQIACPSLGGIYFLSGNTLDFYSIADKTTKTVAEFSQHLSIYTNDEMLYCLYGNSTAGYSVLKYDLTQQKIVKDITLVGYTYLYEIGADDKGRLYIAGEDSSGNGKMFLLSADGKLLSSAPLSQTVYEFTGFDSTNGNFYFEGYLNWIYWGYDHDTDALKCGNVSGDTISLSESYLDLMYQEGWYYHQTNSVLLNNKYIAYQSTLNGRIGIFNSNNFDITGTSLDLALSVTCSGVTDNGVDDDYGYNKIGARTVMGSTADSIVTYVNSNVLAELSLEDNSVINRYTTAHPVFSLIKYNDNVIAVEKDGEDFYLETILWKAATQVNISASASSCTVGNNVTLTAATNSALSDTIVWTSSDNRIASVNENGIVHGWGEGTATITATSSGGAKSSIAITVKANSKLSSPVLSIATGGTSSSNAGDNNYSTWSKPAYSYLSQESNSTLTRVEFISGKVVIENYSDGGKTKNSTKSLEPELEMFGGFFSGSDYNYIVYGQTNYDESDSQEVMKVVKYTKNWTRVNSVSVYGANTYIPFDAGSLRMIEESGKLYVYTCHEMYDTGDGYHHQANMTFVINESDMKVTDSYYDIMNIAQAGYVSHSFNQFIRSNGQSIFRVDHGDANPRAISITRCSAGGSITDVAYTLAFDFDGTYYSNYNYTGASIGGFELSENNCIIAGNFDVSKDSYIRNVFINVTDQHLNKSKMVYLTNYTDSSKITTKTPQLIKVSKNGYLVMWEEFNQISQYECTKMVTIDDNGNMTSDIVKNKMRLSDCQPVVCADGNVRWYATDNSSPVMYAVNPLMLYMTADIDLSDCTVTVKAATYTGSKIIPEVTVKYGSRTLNPSTDYTFTCTNNINAGTANITIKGAGTVKGSVSKTFKINSASIMLKTATLSGTTYMYTGAERKPDVTISGLVKGTDFKLEYKNNIYPGTATVLITGTSNYTGTISKTFTITPKSIAAMTATLSGTTYMYTGVGRKPAVTIEGLVKGTDFDVAYKDNIYPGTATATITGKGNYTGTITKKFTITPASIANKTATLDGTTYMYTGNERRPGVTIEGLKKGTDFTTEYKNNIHPGTATVTITGMGNYTGTITKNFTITPISIANKTATLDGTSYMYTGNERRPGVTIDGLKKGTDFTVEYKNNIHAGTATVTIKGTGDYGGTITKTFTITPVSLSKKTATLSGTTYMYTGVGRKPAVTIDGLVKGTDFTVDYKNNIYPGTATATVIGIGDYKGTITKTFTITAASISSKTAILDGTSYMYSGNERRPAVTIEGLKKGTDFTTEYKNNIYPGTATVTIKGIGNYSGTITKTYTITPASISKKTATLSGTSFMYTGVGRKPEVTISGLVKATDFRVEYKNNIYPGTATVTITGIGNYKDTITKTFTITALSISNKTATLSGTSYMYTGVGRRPEVTISGLVKGTDFKVDYKNNIYPGTATVTITGIGIYKDTITKTFTITRASISNKTATLSQTKYYSTGSEIKPEVKIEGLVYGTDFTVSYKNNIDVGTATVTITGTGNYKDTITKTFTIEKAPYTDNDLHLAEINNISKQTYLDGAEIKPLVTVKLDGVLLADGKDYTVTYKNNINVGTATASITGKGLYVGTVTKTFEIAKRTSTTVLAPRIIGRQSTPYAAVITWVPNFSVNGYEIMYADNEEFSNSKSQTVSGYGANFMAIDNMKYNKENGYDSSKTLYVKVRAYILVDGATKFSGWSDVKTIG